MDKAESTERILGSGLEALSLVFRLVREAHVRYGIALREGLSQVLRWVNLCQRHGAIEDLYQAELVWQRRYYLERYYRRRKLGVCTKCGKPSLSGRAWCEACREKQREYNKRYREKVKVGGVVS